LKTKGHIHHGARMCDEPRCRRKAKKARKKCGTCITQLWRKKNPMKASYVTLRYNAKRRGVPFTITWEYFKRFCYKTNYIAGKGRSALSFSIDRDKNHLGYVPGNIKVMYKGLNSAKSDKPITKKLVYDWHTKHAIVV
jgi:hypothetical protein